MAFSLSAIVWCRRDELRIERSHFIGASWGARLLFDVGEHAPERVLSLTMGGQSPYAMNPNSTGVRMVKSCSLVEAGTCMTVDRAAINTWASSGTGPRGTKLT